MMRLLRVAQYGGGSGGAVGALVNIVEVGYQLTPPAIEGIEAQFRLHMLRIYPV